MNTTKPENIDVYIAGFPENVQKMLEQIRATNANQGSNSGEVNYL